MFGNVVNSRDDLCFAESSHVRHFHHLRQDLDMVNSVV